jgi:hypothetical protein
MIALLILDRRRDVMGSCANGRLTKAAATAIVLALNLLLVLQNRRRSIYPRVWPPPANACRLA